MNEYLLYLGVARNVKGKTRSSFNIIFLLYGEISSCTSVKQLLPTLNFTRKTNWHSLCCEFARVTIDVLCFYILVPRLFHESWTAMNRRCGKTRNVGSRQYSSHEVFVRFPVNNLWNKADLYQFVDKKAWLSPSI